jgi:ribosomal protein S21
MSPLTAFNDGKGGRMSNVVVAVRNGDVMKALRRLRKSCQVSGVFGDIKRHEAYLRPAQKRRLKSVRAQIRVRKMAAKFHENGYPSP